MAIVLIETRKHYRSQYAWSFSLNTTDVTDDHRACLRVCICFCRVTQAWALALQGEQTTPTWATTPASSSQKSYLEELQHRMDGWGKPVHAKLQRAWRQAIKRICNNITFFPVLIRGCRAELAFQYKRMHFMSYFPDYTEINRTCMEASSLSSSLQLTCKHPSGMTSAFN